jgi:hypothetical protein
MARLKVQQNLGVPNYLLFRVASQVCDMRTVTSLVAKLTAADGRVKTWTFYPVAEETTAAALTSRHEFVSLGDTDTLGIYTVTADLMVPNGSIPVVGKNTIEIVAHV